MNTLEHACPEVGSLAGQVPQPHTVDPGPEVGGTQPQIRWSAYSHSVGPVCPDPGGPLIAPCPAGREHGEPTVGVLLGHAGGFATLPASELEASLAEAAPPDPASAVAPVPPSLLLHALVATPKAASTTATTPEEIERRMKISIARCYLDGTAKSPDGGNVRAFTDGRLSRNRCRCRVRHYGRRFFRENEACSPRGGGKASDLVDVGFVRRVQLEETRG